MVLQNSPSLDRLSNNDPENIKIIKNGTRNAYHALAESWKLLPWLLKPSYSAGKKRMKKMTP